MRADTKTAAVNRLSDITAAIMASNPNLLRTEAFRLACQRNPNLARQAGRKVEAEPEPDKEITPEDEDDLIEADEEDNEEQTADGGDDKDKENDDMKKNANSIRDLEAQAANVARQQGITKEQAFAQLLEANPEVYETYRAAHNAGPLLKQLRAAGIELRR